MIENSTSGFICTNLSYKNIKVALKSEIKSAILLRSHSIHKDMMISDIIVVFLLLIFVHNLPMRGVKDFVDILDICIPNIDK